MKAALLALTPCPLQHVADVSHVLTSLGWTIRTLTAGEMSIKTDGQVRIAVDASIEQTSPRDYHLLVVVGGSDASVHDTGLTRFLRQFDVGGRYVAGIGQALLPLAHAKLTGGIRISVDQALCERHKEVFASSICTNDAVSVDGNLITACSMASELFASRLGTILQHVNPQPFTLRSEHQT